MKSCYLIFLYLILFELFASSYAMHFSDEEIKQSIALAKRAEPFEDHIRYSFEKEPDKESGWLTLEKFDFEYKNHSNTFYMVNSFNSSNQWGELAIYPITANLKMINLMSPGHFHFAAKAEPYLSSLKYRYASEKESQKAYFIIEYVQKSQKVDGKGHAQACLKYFLEEFVAKRTKARHVFSDLRSPITQHYFPKYGFVYGSVSDYVLPGIIFPYHWEKETN